jgi:hypothetical protein
LLQYSVPENVCSLRSVAPHSATHQALLSVLCSVKGVAAAVTVGCAHGCCLPVFQQYPLFNSICLARAETFIEFGHAISHQNDNKECCWSRAWLREVPMRESNGLQSCSPQSCFTVSPVFGGAGMYIARYQNVSPLLLEYAWATHCAGFLT